MSEDRFLQHVRSTMTDYRPDVPEAVYNGMRKKLWWSNFTRLSATRFNIWYCAIFLVSAISIYNVTAVDEIATSEVESQSAFVPTEPIPVKADPLSKGNNESSATVNETNTPPTESKKTIQNVNKPASTPATSEVETAKQKASNEVITETGVQEVEPANVPIIESGQPKAGSRKGLKLKSYDSTNKKD